jgi:hypothetical protein
MPEQGKSVTLTPTGSRRWVAIEDRVYEASDAFDIEEWPLVALGLEPDTARRIAEYHNRGQMRHRPFDPTTAGCG